jgi:hypothetical protein
MSLKVKVAAIGVIAKGSKYKVLKRETFVFSL